MNELKYLCVRLIIAGLLDCVLQYSTVDPIDSHTHSFTAINIPTKTRLLLNQRCDCFLE